MNKIQLQNLIIFMNRVQVTGQEAIAWSETFTALQAELATLNAAELASLNVSPKEPLS